MTNHPSHPALSRVAVVGGGPAGLAAAEALARHAEVRVFDAMPSLGRKFLMAGKSGLNITHAEDFERFLGRFGIARATLEPALRDLTPEAIRQWAEGLGVATFVGSSGRVFPKEMKASPLLRAWLARLRDAGVHLHPRHRWQGWDAAGALAFQTPDGPLEFPAAATVLALGGASWPRLGSTGGWTDLLTARGVKVNPLRPANCGFDVDWSEHLRQRFAGTPVKSVTLSIGERRMRGDFVVTRHGIEGSAVYALSDALRDAIALHGRTTLTLDLAPDRDRAHIAAALVRRRGRNSLANHLRKATGLAPVKIALLREGLAGNELGDPQKLAERIKGLPLTLLRPRPIAEAISSAGGIALEELDEHFMLKRLPGVFAVGEMLDWEAPTGGYLLTACLATGRAAGHGVLEHLASRNARAPSRSDQRKSILVSAQGDSDGGASSSS